MYIKNVVIFTLLLANNLISFPSQMYVHVWLRSGARMVIVTIMTWKWHTVADYIFFRVCIFSLKCGKKNERYRRSDVYIFFRETAFFAAVVPSPHSCPPARHRSQSVMRLFVSLQEIGDFPLRVWVLPGHLVSLLPWLNMPLRSETIEKDEPNPSAMSKDNDNKTMVERRLGCTCPSSLNATGFAKAFVTMAPSW